MKGDTIMKKIISLLLILTIIFTSNISFAKAADGNVSIWRVLF